MYLTLARHLSLVLELLYHDVLYHLDYCCIHFTITAFCAS